MSQTRAARLLRTSLLAICVWAGLSLFTFAQSPAPVGTLPSSELNPFLGAKIASIEFRIIQAGGAPYPDPEADKLSQVIPLKAGDLLTSLKLHSSIQALYATGRFADIAVEGARAADGAVALAFISESNFFVGSITVTGEPNPPSASELANVTKLELGQRFDKESLTQAVERMKLVMEDNGYYRSAITADYKLDPTTQQANLFFTIAPSDQALVGKVTISGDPGMSAEATYDAAKLHPGNPVTPARVTRALQRLRKKYQKQKRLESQVSLAARVYDPATNTVDFEFRIQRGPTVDITVEGAHLRRGLIKRYVPVYEENAVDDDLLNEGQRNLRDYLQGEGYFDATVAYRRKTEANNHLALVYEVDRGERHKFTSLTVKGNKYFDSDTIRERMQISTSSLLFFYGRFSQTLLNTDLTSIRALYHNNGFRQAKIDAKVQDDCGKQDYICVEIDINEGRQTLVKDISIQGNKTFSGDELRNLMSTTEGQPYSESGVSTDRDSIATFYFDHGFDDVKIEAFADPDPKAADRVGVRYQIIEGTQQFVKQVIVTGAEHTRPYVIQRELKVAAGRPLSQLDMLDTQRRLYDLGIFSEVNVAIQNPQGTLPRKDVIVEVEEAKRYTFTYGFGFEAQTGDTGNVCLNSISNGGQTVTCSPQGRTGESPRFSFDVTRINFLGRDHTVLMKTVLGRLQQRGLISYEAPHWFNNEDKTLTFTAFYDKTQDVNTFTASRLEGSTQVKHRVNQGTTMLYRFTYRRVGVDSATLQVSPDQLPLLSKPVRVGFPSITFIRDTRDNPITSTRGTYTTADLDVASSIFGSQSSFAKFLVQNSTYYQLNRRNPKLEQRWVLARSTQIGVEEPFGSVSQSFLPLPERFYAGGASSNRAFAINQAGPRDLLTGFPLGGGAVFVNNIELRTPPIDMPWLQDNLSAVIFHDMGNVFDSAHHMFQNFWKVRQANISTCMDVNNPNAGCNFNYMAHAVGGGLRYKTPIGPVRVDLGYTLNPTVFPVRITSPPHFETLKHFNFVFSIGQTF